MAKAHEELKQQLGEKPGKTFALGVTRQVYEWADRIPDEAIRYRIFEEMTVRYETGEKTRLGLDRQEHYRIDAVLFIQPGYRALNQNQCFTVGIELKNTKADLMGDHKMDKYLGWTDLFFIGVPADLKEDAIKKAEEVSLQVFGGDPKYGMDSGVDLNKYMVGVFNIDNGQIYKMPARKQSVSMENRLKIQEQVIYNVLFDDIKTVNVKLDEIDLVKLPEASPTLPTHTGGGTMAPATEATTTSSAATLENPAAKASGLIVVDTLGLSEDPSGSPETPSDGLGHPNATNTIPKGKEDGTEAGNAKLGHSSLDGKFVLDEEFVAARNEKRAENRARRKELARNLTDRNRQLTERTREQLAGLTDRDMLVFWTIRDATVKGGINGLDIPDVIGQSLSAVNRCIKKLKKHGLIAFEGGAKYGKYKVIGDALKSSRCITCRLNEECAGTALHCGSYQAVE